MGKKVIVKENSGFRQVSVLEDITVMDFYKELFEDGRTDVLESFASATLKNQQKNLIEKGLYFIKASNSIRFNILVSENNIGLNTMTTYGDYIHFKTLIYDLINNKYVLMWSKNTLDNNTVESKRYNGYEENTNYTLTKEKATELLDALFEEFNYCENIDKILDIKDIEKKINTITKGVSL